MVILAGARDDELEGYHVGFLHRDSLREILRGNITDFEAFGLNHRLVFPRKKLERLKAEPEENWDLIWTTTLVGFCQSKSAPNEVVKPKAAHPRRILVDHALQRIFYVVPALGAAFQKTASAQRVALRRAKPSDV